MCKLLIGRIGIISFFGTEWNVLWVCQIFVVKFLLYKDTGNVDWIPFRASFLQEIDIWMLFVYFANVEQGLCIGSQA